MTPQEEILRGEDAKQIYNHPMFKEAVQTVRNGLTGGMERSALGDESTHHRLVIALQLLGQIERALVQVMETGDMAALQVRDGMMDRLKRVI